MLIQQIKQHTKQNVGDMYIQMLICLSAFIIIVFFLLQISSAMTQKLWLDEQINDITKLVSIRGSTTGDEIQEIEQEIQRRFGGSVTYECSYVDDIDGTVQLGDTVIVSYKNDTYPIISIGNQTIYISVNIERRAVSEVYYKPA